MSSQHPPTPKKLNGRGENVPISLTVVITPQCNVKPPCCTPQLPTIFAWRGGVCLSVQREDTAVYSYTGCAQDRGPQENPYLFSTRSIHPLHTPAMRCQIKIPMVWTEGKEAQGGSEEREHHNPKGLSCDSVPRWLPGVGRGSMALGEGHPTFMRFPDGGFLGPGI